MQIIYILPLTNFQVVFKALLLSNWFTSTMPILIWALTRKWLLPPVNHSRACFGLIIFYPREYKIFLYSVINAFSQNINIKDPLLSYIRSHLTEFEQESSALSFLVFTCYNLNESEIFLPTLFEQLKSWVSGEQQDLSRFSISLANIIFDERMLINSRKLIIPGATEEMCKALRNISLVSRKWTAM